MNGWAIFGVFLYIVCWACVVGFPYLILFHVSSPLWSNILWSIYGIAWFIRCLHAYEQLRDV